MKFHCQDCGKEYTACKCVVYQSYFKGGGRMTDSWETWKSSRQPKQGKIRRTGAARGIPEPLTLD